MNLGGIVCDVFRGERFREQVSNSSVRQAQIDMARSVSDLCELGGTAVLEAGTGVGKSFAYLIPAVLSGQASVVSTATITLQDQLLNKDIPSVSRILDRNIDAAVLKGRSNYLCLRKWSLWGGKALPGITDWVEKGGGDISTLDYPVKPSSLSKVTGDSLDCLGSRCPEMHRCFYYRARNNARRASVLIVNHHLLLCGLETGDLIPEAWLLVADEAHALHNAASSTLGHILTENSLNGVFDAITLGNETLERKTELLGTARQTASLISGLVSAGDGNGDVQLSDIQTELQDLADSAGALSESMTDSEDLAGARQILKTLEKTALSIARSDSGDWCCYTVKNGRHSVLKSVPVNPGSMLRDRLYGSFPAVLLTSATLTSGGSFTYCDELLGVPPEAEKKIFESPFDYQAISVLATPDDSPGHDDHIAVSEEAWRTASEAASILAGRTMVLFTSYRNMELCVKAAESEPVQGIRLLVQGSMSRSVILDSFRNDPRAIILGTASFWEGVDLPGEMLQALVIDRIPFPSPGHPLVKARMKYFEDAGKNSFSSVMLPEAATRLKQGAGRLIRSSTDTGAVFILDRRMRTAGYAQVLFRSMPPFRRTSREEAMTFLREQASLSSGITFERSQLC